MKNSDIRGEIEVSLDKYENVRLSWFMDDGMFDNIPFQVVMSPKEAQKLADDIGDVIYGELDEGFQALPDDWQPGGKHYGKS